MIMVPITKTPVYRRICHGGCLDVRWQVERCSDGAANESAGTSYKETLKSVSAEFRPLKVTGGVHPIMKHTNDSDAESVTRK
jgi:hypothetical protein